jgi:hypothetical protein
MHVPVRHRQADRHRLALAEPWGEGGRQQAAGRKRSAIVHALFFGRELAMLNAMLSFGIDAN